MSFITPPPTTNIWDTPSNNPPSVPAFTGDPSAVDGTTTPVQVGGSNNTFQTLDAATGQTNQVVLSGANNQLIVGTGQQYVQTIGGGNIVESQQSVLPDGTKIISVGTFGGPCSDSENGSSVNEGITVSANFVGTQASIDAMSGGLGGPFLGYAHGGTGDDFIYGSCEADFLRGGQGDDEIYAYGGNDVVRGGDGSDKVWLGDGSDYLYYTPDQVLGGDVDSAIDFTQGLDKVAFYASLTGGAGNFSKFSGFNTNTLTYTNGGAVTQIVSVSENAPAILWQQTDIYFVV